MTKESKNLGISKACPECRKTLLAAVDIEGIGKFKAKCPHCGNLILIEISQKTTIKLSKVVTSILIVIFIVFIGYSSFQINRKLNGINENVQAISEINQNWDIFLNNK